MFASAALAVIGLFPTVWSSQYKLNRYYGNNINAEGTPSSTVILNSEECYSFPAWFGQTVQYFDGGWMVTCYDTIQADTYGTYQIEGEVQIQFVQNDGPSSYSCNAPTSTNLYDVYVPSIIYDSSPTIYSVYYWDSNTQTITQEFGSTSIECFQAVPPPERSDCPFSDSISRRRLSSSTDKYHTASFNVSVNIVLGAGVDPSEWIKSRFSANNFSNPWKALDNDMIPYLNNRGTTVEGGRRLSSGHCAVWGFACTSVAKTVVSTESAIVISGGSLGSAGGVTFALQCEDGVMTCVTGSLSSSLTEPTTFALSFNYQLSTTLEYATAHALFVDAIQTKLNTNLLDGFPTFGTALSFNGTAPTNLTVTDVIVPKYSSASDGTAKVSTTNIITIACVLGGVLLLAVVYCLKRLCCPSTPAAAPIHPSSEASDDKELYV